MLGCQVCPNGYQANASQSECLACLPFQYKSATMLNCLDCGIGSQSNNNVCAPCSSGYVRDASMSSCSLCPIGSVPAFQQTSCFSCPSPAIWVGSWSIGAQSYTTWTNGTCIDCPSGQYPTGFSCSSCYAPSIRSSQTTCVSCDDGFEPNAERTICFPCTGNSVRTGPTPFCFECPTGTKASDDHTRCIKPIKPFLSASQSALLAISILILVASVSFRTTLKESQFIAGISMALFFLVFSFVLPSTQTK